MFVLIFARTWRGFKSSRHTSAQAAHGQFTLGSHLNGSRKIKINPHHYHRGKRNNKSKTMKLSLKSHETDLYEQ